VSWIEAVSSPEGVLAVYGGEAPALTGLVRRLEFTWRGPSVVLSVALRDYPSAPPAKWAERGCDTVLLTLYCFGAEDVRLTGWAAGVVADMAVERTDGRVAVALDSPAATLSLSAVDVFVQQVSAYRHGSPGSTL
jgi:Immunity protein 50